jgi:hypothetical protein
MTVYLVVGSRRTLHKAVQSEAGVMSLEADNIDDSKAVEVYTDWNAAKSAAKRWCRRCFSSGPVA